MSVIMAYKTKDKIYLGADNRVYTVENEAIRDNEKKIVVINDNVAVAFAGYNGTQTIFENIIKEFIGNVDFRVEDALICLKRIYWIYKLLWYKKVSKNAFTFGSRFIIAGKNKKDECCVYKMSILHGKLEKPSLTDIFIFPPSDASAKECWDCFAKNVISGYSDFIHRTVKDVSKMSDYVSESCDVWIYDVTTDAGTLQHFSEKFQVYPI